MAGNALANCEDESETNMSVLSKMQENVDLLWQKVIYAKSPEEREDLRKEYFRALDIYKKQCLITDELKSPEKSISPVKNVTDSKGPMITVISKTVEESAPVPGSSMIPSPFDFPDYVDYLMSYLSYRKENEPNIILEFTKVTGISGDSLKKVVRRSKKIESKEHNKILKYINLPENESEFLEVLYLLSVSDSGLDRTKAMQQLARFDSFKKKNPDGYEAWRYLSHWYYPAIREMATLPEFKMDPFWIQSQLVRFVSVTEIRKCLNFLIGAQFIKAEEDGKVVSRHKHINCTGGLYRLALRNYHKEMLEVAISSITSLSSDKRMLLAHTVAVPESKKDLLFRILAETIEKVQALGAGENSEDEIYHVELAALPLTQKN